MIPSASTSFRMADLVRITGIPKETIHFYLREGLLPPAEKTSRNMAWYSDHHVHTLTIIRDLQDQHLLPLKAIKALLYEKENFSFTPAQRELIDRIRKQKLADLAAVSKPGHITVAALAHDMNITPDELAELRKTGMVCSDDHEIPDRDEAEILNLWATIREAGLTPARGFSPRDITFIARAVDRLFEDEVLLFKERLSDLGNQEIAPLLNIVLPSVNRLFALRHERKLNALLEAFGTPQSDSPVPTIKTIPEKNHG